MMKHSKTGIPSIRTSTLMLAISMAMVGCGGGSSSNSGGTDQTMVVLHLNLSRVLKRNICKKGSVKTRQHNALNPYSSIAFSKVRPIS
jgi:hypothetical protein